MSLNERVAPLDLGAEDFRTLGHGMVDRLADLLTSFGERRVTPGEPPSRVRELLGQSPLPEQGKDPAELLAHAADLLIDHSLHNGHPRFMGYITSSAHPIGILGDFLASAVNANCGAWALSPMATEMESQAIRWIAELIGYPSDAGGILVSGGAMANYACFLAARHAKAPWDIRKDGTGGAGSRRLRVYCSADTHTWIQKASDMFGLGTDAVRWVGTDDEGRLSMAHLRAAIEADEASGDAPFLVIGTAGSVGTGAVDPLGEIADLCGEKDLWFHVDGAYGALAARASGAPRDLAEVTRADSVAVDPHKWLYAPLEAGCVLVRDVQALRGAFSYRPSYFRFEEAGGEEPISYYEYGPQNSRGSRAVKVWLGLKQVGRQGYLRMIGDDIALARRLYDQAQAHPELQGLTHNLSITTYRYVPKEIDPLDSANTEYLNALNEELLGRMQEEGEAFVSHAIVEGAYVLRACIVNFRTAADDVDAVAELSVRLGREVAAAGVGV